MLMGDSSAVTLGVDLDRVRGVLILSSALLTASAVAVSGCIGFVGLVIPHLVRSVVGADHRRLIPLSALCGAVFMIWMDVGARCCPAGGDPGGHHHRLHRGPPCFYG